MLIALHKHNIYAYVYVNVSDVTAARVIYHKRTNTHTRLTITLLLAKKSEVKNQKLL